MQSLPAPAWGLTRRAPRGRRWVPLAAALVLLVAAVAALALVFSAGRDDAARAPAAHRVAPGVASGTALINGHPLQQADCTDWNAGTGAQRAAVVDSLRATVGGATGYGPAVTLPNDQAVALFGRACAGTIARGWLLYSLYTRAAGFQSQRR
jgi:hypothetical protein